jgi:hypothetical protein
MFCAFEGSPRILRLYGHGRVHEPGDVDFDELRAHFPELPGERAIVDVAVHRVATSCGYGVPRMELLESREELLVSAERKGPEKLARYRYRRNAQSIDGLPGMGNSSDREGVPT